MTGSIPHPETILDHLIVAEERRDHHPLRFGVTSQVTLKDTTALAIGLDRRKVSVPTQSGRSRQLDER
jgi:hypothetical protein